jgi:hypothetical protein
MAKWGLAMVTATRSVGITTGFVQIEEIEKCINKGNKDDKEKSHLCEIKCRRPRIDATFSKRNASINAMDRPISVQLAFFEPVESRWCKVRR